MSNPFFHGNPVAADQFLDRRRELTRIRNRILNQGQSSAIVGEPRSGKTSLLEYLAAPEMQGELYGADGAQLLFTYLDAQTLAGQFSQAQFWEYCLGPLYRRAIAPEPDSMLSQAYAICQQNNFGAFVLERLLAQMAQAGWRLVLMLDEFDLLLHHPVLHSAEFFGSLRSLASRSRGALALIIASRRPLEALNQETQELSYTGSPYFNFLDEITLGPWPGTAVDELLRWAGDRFTPGDRSFIKEVGAGHPCLLQTAASALWEAYEEREGDPALRRQQAGRDLYDTVAPILQDTWRCWPPEARKAATAVALAHLNALSNQVGRAQHDQYDIATVRELVRESFGARELRRFCEDSKTFSTVVSQFGPGFSKEEMIDVLVRHSKRQVLLADLLQEIRGYNPRQYERYAPQLAPQHALGLLDLGPELHLLEKQGAIAQDAAIPGGWRVGPQVLLWWLADELACVAHSQGAFETWLQDQVLQRRLTWDEQQQMGELFGAVQGLPRGGAAALIEAVGKPSAQR